MDILSACLICEGETPASEEETISAWQFLLNNGMVWKLQGFYGRTAQAMIEQGLITEPK